MLNADTDAQARPDEQDKRSVVPIEPEDVDEWLFGSVEQAAGLMRVPLFELIDAWPVG